MTEQVTEQSTESTSLTPDDRLRSQIGDIIGRLPAHALEPLKELATSAEEVAAADSVDAVTLRRIVQRMFARSVNEFFTAERSSTRLTAERTARFRPSEDVNRIDLPQCVTSVDTPVDEVMGRRRSGRDFTARPLPLLELASVLRRAFGKNGSEDVRRPGSPAVPLPLNGWPVRF